MAPRFNESRQGQTHCLTIRDDSIDPVLTNNQTFAKSPARLFIYIRQKFIFQTQEGEYDRILPNEYYKHACDLCPDFFERPPLFDLAYFLVFSGPGVCTPFPNFAIV